MNVKTAPGWTQLKDPESGLTYQVETAYMVKNRISRGDKIAQIEVVTALGDEFGSSIVDELNQTRRGAGGFGSTGD
jgi:dUTPase